MSSEAEYDHLFKILVLGDSDAGKSELVQEYVEDRTPVSRYAGVVGVDYRTKILHIDGKQCKLILWDTAGQERFKTITSSYYQGVAGIVIVFSTSDDQYWFEHVKSWLTEVFRYVLEDTPILIVRNLTDLHAKKQLSTDKIKEFAVGGISFIETSVNDSTEMQKAMLNMARQILKKLDTKILETSKENEKVYISPAKPRNSHCQIQ